MASGRYLMVGYLEREGQGLTRVAVPAMQRGPMGLSNYL